MAVVGVNNKVASAWGGNAAHQMLEGIERTTSAANAESSGEIVRIKLWTEGDFANAESSWQSLLARSGADPLFMSWVWQFCWWRHHAKTLKSKLVIFAAYSADGNLVGIAPFHLRRVRHHRFICCMRLELLGSTFRCRGNAFSEYLDFIVDHKYRLSFMGALKQALGKEVRWSDLVIANVSQHSLAAQFAREYLSDKTYVREIDKLTAHITKFPDQFSEYLKALAPAIRRKLWNHRSKLSEPKIQFVDRDGIEDFLSKLSKYHVHRWGIDASEKLKSPFYLDIAQHLADRRCLRMSYLVNAGQPISAMFNVRIGDTEYNIQSGFDHNALPHASLGYLHFGFALEDASANGIRNFNFLAGRGRNRDYKQDFLTAEEGLATFQIIKAWPLAWLYRGYDRRLFSLLGMSLPYLSSLFGVFEISDVCACSI